jgi:SAM-dependent methyltransferase
MITPPQIEAPDVTYNLPGRERVRNAIERRGVGYPMREFEDYFSRRAETYVRHRPTYPEELYAYLASIVPHRRLAWDCGTGNGQAALGLADHFDRIVATDASADQITQAPRHSRVEFRVARSEEAGLETRSAALVTVAVAVHWFDFDRFYAEVRRVLSPGGLIAVWCYSLPAIDPAIDAILEHYLRDTLSGYWPDRFRYVFEQYRTLPFPFKELAPPRFTMETDWDLSQVLGFLQSWSGTAMFEKQKGQNPIELIDEQLSGAWGIEDRKRNLHWRLFLRIGQVQ